MPKLPVDTQASEFSNATVSKPLAAARPGSKLLVQKIAFALIRGLSFFTLGILVLILGFITYRGLWSTTDTRYSVLPIQEAQPEGLMIVVNRQVNVDSIQYPQLSGLFADEYINWVKIDGTDKSVLAIIDQGALAQLPNLFGNNFVAGTLVTISGDLPDALGQVASTPGAILVTTAFRASSLIAQFKVKALSLERIALCTNPEVLALKDNKRLKEVNMSQVTSLVTGDIKRWSSLGGPDIPVVLFAPPVGSSLNKATGARFAFDKAVASADMATCIAQVSSTPGAAGFLFFQDALDNNLKPLTIKGQKSGWNLSVAYLVTPPKLSGRVGGISSILINTFFMLLLTLVIAVPIGVGAAIYLVEYARQGKLIRIIRLGVETLAGIPSIIFGLFGFLFFVNILHLGFGLAAGCLTLSLMIMPTIVRTSEEAIKAVPQALREGSLALGATKLTTIMRVVLPGASQGILIGIVLAAGRAIGETAALLFTMGSDYQTATGLSSSARSLANHVYLLFAEGISLDRAFSTGLVLVIVVLIFNSLIRLAIGRNQNR